MKNVLLMTTLMAALAATGCAGTKWRVSGKCQSGRGCEVEGSIEGVIKSSAKTLVARVYESAETFDAASFSLDTGGSTLSVPSSGLVTINLVDTVSGATVTSATVPWRRNGTSIVLADPDSVNRWALAHGGSADSLTYKLHPFPAPSSYGELQVTSMYEGVANSSVTIVNTGSGGSCRYTRCHAQ
ncbi:hypothetical protein [Lysobacter sp. N42]|uniref:hypothetical protein n=1 Tax=Lysobacter sp. N42 TaxID=2545719 RepID=UPI0010499995|nr:hypothetical protein [Lysobacter sp. N42]TCZ87749.1 hypothetical protein EYQ95_15675 [Lysobacter sp. N42]